MDYIYIGPYKIERDLSTEQHLYIMRGVDLVKVAIRNVKAYVGPLNFEDTIEAENKNSYNLRQQETINYNESSEDEL